MTNVKPEHAIGAMELLRDPHCTMTVAQLLADLDTARADARVLASEVRMWRENDGCCEANAGKAIHRTLHLDPVMDATDASGALERSRP